MREGGEREDNIADRKLNVSRKIFVLLRKEDIRLHSECHVTFSQILASIFVATSEL